MRLCMQKDVSSMSPVILFCLPSEELLAEEPLSEEAELPRHQPVVVRESACRRDKQSL